MSLIASNVTTGPSFAEDAKALKFVTITSENVPIAKQDDMSEHSVIYLTGEQEKEIPEEVRLWHHMTQETIEGYDKLINTVPEKRSINLAQFRICVTYADHPEQTVDFTPYLFLSCGNLERINLESLPDSISPIAMDNVFLSEEKPKDAAYRKSILEFLNFKEKLNDDDKKRILDYANYTLQDFFKETGINRSKQTGLKDLFKKSLMMGGFDAETNQSALDLLGYKADDLFKDFNHHFYHSEQVLRIFIEYFAYTQETSKIDECLEGLKKSRELLSHQKTPLQVDQSAKYIQTALASLDEHKIKVLELPWQALLPLDGKKLNDLTNIRLDLCTHRHICSVCCGTFHYDLKEKYQLKKAIIYALVQAQIAKYAFSDVYSTNPESIQPELDCLQQIEKIIENNKKEELNQLDFFNKVNMTVLVSGIREKR